MGMDQLARLTDARRLAAENLKLKATLTQLVMAMEKAKQSLKSILEENGRRKKR